MKNFQWKPAQSLKQYFTTHIRAADSPPDEEDCPICIQPWRPTAQEIVQTNCGHVFHRLCLVIWLTQETDPRSCPNCRDVFFPRAVAPNNAVAAPGTNIILNDQGEWDSVPVSEISFNRMVAFVKYVLTPILDADEIREQFDIDLHPSRPLRFLRAMTKVCIAGLGLLHFPVNLQQGWMSKLKHHLVDWLTIKFLIATLFMQAHSKLMSSKHWVEALAVRHRLYLSAINSADFGARRPAFLDHIVEHHAMAYEIAIAQRWPGCEFSSVHWRECDEQGNIIYSGQHDSRIVGSILPFFVGFSDASASPRPRMYFENGSLWLSEAEVGSITEISLDQASRTVIVHSAAGQTLRVQFVDKLCLLQLEQKQMNCQRLGSPAAAA
jgi:hypothetical protein